MNPETSNSNKSPITLNDHAVKCISIDGRLRGIALQAPHLVEQIYTLHQMDEPLFQKGLGEALIAGLLLAATGKNDDHFNLTIRGNSLYRFAIVDATAEGTVRGYLVPGEPMDRSENTYAFGPWGEGTLSVLRYHEGNVKNQYQGTVPLTTGTLAKDFTFYWAQSEQIPTALGIHVTFDKGILTNAMGFLVQALPGATDEDLVKIELAIRGEEHTLTSKEHNSTGSPRHFLSRLFQDFGFQILEEKPLAFRCRCSQDRVERAIAFVGVDELKSMVSENKGASITCEFCSQTYQIAHPVLEATLEKASAEASTT